MGERGVYIGNGDPLGSVRRGYSLSDSLDTLATQPPFVSEVQASFLTHSLGCPPTSFVVHLASTIQ